MNRPGTAARDLAFPDLGDLAHLDTATMGVLPGEAAAALHDAVTQWTRGTGDHGVWEAAAEEARGLVAGLVGMSACDVALLPSHVAAATTVARAWPDARVVVPEAEFRANLLPWIADRDRGAVRLVPSPATTDALCAAVDQGPDLVAVSSVQSADGLRVDLPRLVEHAHRRGALVYVDASQSLGVDATLGRCGADFIAAVGYKWLLGARGTAFLAVRPEHQRRFAPVLTGPESCADGAIYGAGYRLWDDARRFDQPQAWQAWVATAASLRHLCAYDQAELERHATGLAGRFVEAVHALGVATTPADVPSAIVGVTHPDPQSAVQRLREAGVRAAARAESLRFAFHLYTTERDVDRAIAALAATTGSTT
ncbi:aminotransferase class V-fold PLP-dependent enzyme [Pseudonocardia kunmingensis]|uniref:Selenocysteine lyase/cysteine desulfurase n=1 Tax=Pseudonocardia kunmingensis TaxID=630975 RepID=A0A543D0X2_9PSEU|nr:aminotransferase class V-fold PLP-dependent enzyme [Pseudonocardia kunmingensis]TQM02828.1 selenocysteine lyase/cysteine desulfurase [Pseudonocardia kunmingensis]